MAFPRSCASPTLASPPISPRFISHPRLPSLHTSSRQRSLVRDATKCHTTRNFWKHATRDVSCFLHSFRGRLPTQALSPLLQHIPTITYCLPPHHANASAMGTPSIREPAATPASHSRLQAASLLGLVWREIYISYRFNNYDFASVVAPGILTALVTHLKSKAATQALWVLLPKSCVITWICIYQFTLANQLVGVKEDTINKPTRPIPSGLVTPQGTLTRLAVVTPLVLIVGYAFHVGPYTAAWAAIAFLQNFSSFLTGGWHWLTKPIVMFGYNFTVIAANAGIVRPMGSSDLFYCAVLATAFAVGSSLQDLRDVEGDRQERRTTLPMLVGDEAARRICALLCMSVWGVMQVSIGCLARDGVKAVGTSAMIGVWCVILSVRTLQLRGPKADHLTYTMFLYLLSFLVIVPLWIP